VNKNSKTKVVEKAKMIRFDFTNLLVSIASGLSMMFIGQTGAVGSIGYAVVVYFFFNYFKL